ncbi:hypothetical protein EJ885_17990, partial [Escherichia coli]
DGAVSGMPAIRETGPGKNLQAITVSIKMHDRVGWIRRLRRIRHGKRALCYQSGASKCWPDLFLREDYDAQNAAGGSTFSDGNDRSRRLPVQRHAA